MVNANEKSDNGLENVFVMKLNEQSLNIYKTTLHPAKLTYRRML